MKKSIAIICGGGPAPGINTVISTLTKTFLKDGYEVLGIHHGYKGLFSENPSIKIFNFQSADRIFSRGGSTLTMSRFKPKDSDFKADFFQKNNVKLLVTIGGDDTASTASRLTKYLTNQQLDVAHIHVPKTIDNDLPLPDRNPTFGFHTAKDEIKNSGINFTYDDHGHPELGNVSKSPISNYLLQVKLKKLGLDIKSRPVEIGYELRCCNPIAFDLTLCTLLGIGVKKLFDQGITGCIVSANSNGDIAPLYLKDFEDENGKIQPRLVDIESDMAQLFIKHLIYIRERDYEEAKQYVEDPSAYDFKKILNWT